MSSGAWSAVISALGLGISVVAFVVLVIQLQLLREQVRHAKDAFVEEQRRTQRQATLEFLASTLGDRLALQKRLPSEEDPEEVKKFLENDANLESNDSPLWAYLNFHEMIAVGVNCTVFDPEVVQRVMGPRLVRTFDAYRELILAGRESDGRPSMYKELETVAHTMRQSHPDDQRSPA
ncbi:DUF4760 domain-containing protein [Dactylosporangium sp. AC04546]|uniref:DUF4760 domain-containing protein n=1 Tax=Dactylosporangium sp. AC04546 TaxID=2862460 RepID=UPI001EE15482|nr:DUF4760 domain-containing protein [Dactylosporangium sp. AC04546]WVK78932.1 DUF4760 domain-containing protein [Dactylosporangium sp. AC04546]